MAFQVADDLLDYTAALETTGKASFCGDPDTEACAACTRDTDCEAMLGAGAACIYCAAVCPMTQGRVCILAAPGT